MPERAIYLILGALGLAALALRRGSLRGTTLIGPWSWHVVAIGAVSLAECVLAGPSTPPWTAHARYAAATLTLAPMIALLGAKRPQHRAWQWIVCAFVIVLALPAASSHVLNPGRPLSPHPLYLALIAGLIAMELANGLPTRNWISAILTSAGQLILFAHVTPFLASVAGWPRSIGLGLYVAAAALGLLRAHRSRNGGAPSPDRALRAFADEYGWLWSRRVWDRFNTAARQHGWRAGIDNRGLVREAEISPATERAKLRHLRAILRRFVSHEWIERRMGGG